MVTKSFVINALLSATLVSQITLAQGNKKEATLIRLKCSGTQVTKWQFNDKDNGSRNITFLVNISFTNQTTTIFMDGLALWGTNSALSSPNLPNGIVQRVTESDIVYGAEFTLKEPLTGGGHSLLKINRYTGAAKQTELIVFTNKAHSDLGTITGDYTCSPTDKKLF